MPAYSAVGVSSIAQAITRLRPSDDAHCSQLDGIENSHFSRPGPSRNSTPAPLVGSGRPTPVPPGRPGTPAARTLSPLSVMTDGDGYDPASSCLRASRCSELGQAATNSDTSGFHRHESSTKLTAMAFATIASAWSNASARSRSNRSSNSLGPLSKAVSRLTGDLPPTAINVGRVPAIKCCLRCWRELIALAVHPRPITRDRAIAGFICQGLIKHGPEGGYLLSICRGHDPTLAAADASLRGRPFRFDQPPENGITTRTLDNAGSSWRSALASGAGRRRCGTVWSNWHRAGTGRLSMLPRRSGPPVPGARKNPLVERVLGGSVVVAPRTGFEPVLLAASARGASLGVC